MENLLQVGFIAMLRAVDSYEPTRARFSTHLFPFLQTEFSIATGQRLKRTALDPLQQAVSLDVPLTDDEEDDTLGDLIPDPAAQAAMEAIGERGWHEHLHSALETALNTLRPEERQVIVAHYYQGRTLTEIAADEGVSRTAVGRREQKAMMRLRHPSRSKALRAYL